MRSLTTLRMTALVLAGVLMLACWAAAVLDAIPPRSAVEHQAAGVKAYLAHDLGTAQREFRRVLDARSDATSARLGIACILWDRGRKSGAAIELMKAILAGLPYPLRAKCGSRTDLSRFFLRRAIGTTLVVLVPRGALSSVAARRAKTVLDSHIPIGPAPRDDARRLMAAACLAWRNDYYSLANEYALLASSLGGPRAQELPTFLQCVGKRRALIRCAAEAVRLGQCAFRGDVAESLRRDRKLGHL